MLIPILFFGWRGPHTWGAILAQGASRGARTAAGEGLKGDYPGVPGVTSWDNPTYSTRQLFGEFYLCVV